MTRADRHRAWERTLIKLHWRAVHALRTAFAHANDNADAVA
jgi:hypothetical protein